MALSDDIPGASGPAQAIQSSQYNPLNVIQNGQQQLDALANKYLLKPANAKGINGFLFDYEGETQVVVQSEITDHYSELNAFFNDQAAQKPQRITLRGFVAEVVTNPNLGVLGAINTLQGKLSSLQAIAGKYTPSVVQKIQSGLTSATTVVNKINTDISKAQNFVGLFLGSAAAATKQQKAYQTLYAMWLNNTVFTLDTPFNYFRSVMIESMTMIQPEDTKGWAEFSITVKEVRFIDDSDDSDNPGMSSQLALATQDGRSQYQSQNPTNKGQTQGIFSSFGNVSGAFA